MPFVGGCPWGGSRWKENGNGKILVTDWKVTRSEGEAEEMWSRGMEQHFSTQRGCKQLILIVLIMLSEFSAMRLSAGRAMAFTMEECVTMRQELAGGAGIRPV